MRRPLIEYTIVFWLGLIIASKVNFLAIMIFFGVICALYTSVYVSIGSRMQNKQIVAVAFLFISVAVIASGFYQIRTASQSLIDELENESGAVSGIVQSVGAYSSVFSECQIEFENGLTINLGKLLVKPKWGTEPEWKVGQRVLIEGTMHQFEGERNPGTFDSKRYYGSKGIDAYFKLKKVNTISDDVTHPLYNIGRLQSLLTTMVQENFSQEDSALILGLILGRDDDISKETILSFRMSGIAHVLAVSGLHFGILYMMIYKILLKLKLPYYVVQLTTIVIMGIFVLVTGCSFSAMRAFAMICIHAFSVPFRRKYDLLSALGLVALTSMLINPFVIWNVGFQLSFWAVFAIGGFGHIRPNLKDTSLEMVLFPLMVQTMLTPLMIFHFNRFYTYSLFFNLPVAVLMPPLIIVVVLTLPFRNMPIIGWGMTGLSESLLESLRSIADLVNRLPMNEIPIGTYSKVVVVLMYLIVSVLILSKTVRDRSLLILKNHYKACVCATLFVLIIFSLPNGRNEIVVDFLDVGQGDAVLIHGLSGGHVLIDSGPPKAGLEDILLKQGITKLDAVYLSHPHADHYSGFNEIAGIIKIESFYYARSGSEPEVMEQLKASYKKTEFIEMLSGDVVQWQGITLKSIHPGENAKGLDANNMSLTLLMGYEDQKILFTGDIEKEVEKRLISYLNNVDVDILKVAHHGSKTSSTKDFVDVITPELAVIQVGRNNFGHPSPETLETFDGLGVPVFRNDNSGCIRIRLRKDERVVIPWLTSAH